MFPIFLKFNTNYSYSLDYIFKMKMSNNPPKTFVHLHRFLDINVASSIVGAQVEDIVTKRFEIIDFQGRAAFAACNLNRYNLSEPTGQERVPVARKHTYVVTAGLNHQGLRGVFGTPSENLARLCRRTRYGNITSAIQRQFTQIVL